MAKFIKLGYKKNIYLNIDDINGFRPYKNLDEIRNDFGWDSNIVDEAKLHLELEEVNCVQKGFFLVLFYCAKKMTFVLMKKEHFVWLTEDLLNVVKLPSSVLDSQKELTDKQADDLIDTCEKDEEKKWDYVGKDYLPKPPQRGKCPNGDGPCFCTGACMRDEPNVPINGKHGEALFDEGMDLLHGGIDPFDDTQEASAEYIEKMNRANKVYACHNERLPIVYPRYSRKGDNHFVAWAFNGMYDQIKRQILEGTPIIPSKQFIEEQIEGDSQYLDALIGEYEANHGVIYDSFIAKHFLVKPNFNNTELKPL